MKKLDPMTVLLTGAAGGIGSATALELGRAGAKLVLTDLRAPALESLAARLGREGIDATPIAANLASAEDRAELVSDAELAGVDTLINIAGVNPFGWLEQQTEAEIELALRVNTLAPVLLCRAMLPVLAANAPARIVNVGSAFGGIGYPGFAAYCASKFAIRGFSEALRRELADTGIRVQYVAPRATRTPLVTDRVRALNEELGIAMDPPEIVARAIVAALRSGRRELAVGSPERLFAKLNAWFPRVIDAALAKQLPTIRRHATGVSTHDAAHPQAAAIHPSLQERTP